ncbi:retrovirus-related Pol polyprotein from transposon 297 [Trichonephila clavata]|uniref:Retrovirus-related Pol polyprotein from transposon 297 n=1 Tax=Trichonephila clavata TaxID=2740835 RepID=A0A8X6GK84_TRICU|nr:retrovirus-related Pol polyprotein from transposon 297 [Trichonephila clavata]
MLATELGLAPSDNLKIIELKDLITNSDGYDEEFVKDVLNVIVEERTTTEKQKAMELEDKQKAVAVAQQQEREFELEKLRIQLEMQKLSQAPVKLDAYDSLRPVMKNNPNQTFKKKEEFRKPFPIKKSQPVGGYHDNHSPGPSRTVPRFPSSRTEGRKPIQCYGCGTPGVVKSKCPTCTRTNEMETEVNCMTLFNLNSDLYPSSVIVLKIFGEKIAVCADTGASHTIAGEKLFKFLQEHGITFTNKVISFMMADGIRQTITALRTVVDLYIEGKVIPTEFLVLPEAKGNKTLLGLDFLNAAGIVLDVQGGKWHFSENPRNQYIFFKKTIKDLNISAFDLREDEAKHLSREHARKLNKLLDKNETCFQPGGEPTPFIEHRIDTGDHPQ